VKDIFTFSPFQLLVLLVSLAIPVSCPLKSAHAQGRIDVIVVARNGGVSAGAHLASKGLKCLFSNSITRWAEATTNFTRGAFTFEAALHGWPAGARQEDRGLYSCTRPAGGQECDPVRTAAFLPLRVPGRRHHPADQLEGYKKA